MPKPIEARFEYLRTLLALGMWGAHFGSTGAGEEIKRSREVLLLMDSNWVFEDARRMDQGHRREPVLS